MILYIGATGHLGKAAVQELCKRGHKVRCLVRGGADTSQLKNLSTEFVYGDACTKESIRKAVAGTDTVMSSFATNIAKDRRTTHLWQNDYEGNLAVIKHAKSAGVKKFVFISYWGLAKFGDFEHGKIKKMVEDLLAVSGLDYTVLRVTSLATDMSLLLGNTLQKKGRAPILMKRHEKIRPILLEDLAWCMADCLTNPKASHKVIEVAGEEEYTFMEFQELFSQALGKKVRFIFIPLPLANFIAGCIDFVTRNQYNARGLVSAFTGGSTCDITQMQQIFRLQQGSFAQHLKDYFTTGHIVFQEPRSLS